MVRRFGSEVTIVEMGPRLIHREDEDDDVSEAIREILKTKASTSDSTIRESLARICFSQSAACRTTDDLGLENAGVTVDQRGYVQVDDQLQTNVPGIFALGDCNGRGAFTHTSYNDYEIVAANLLDHDRRAQAVGGEQ